MSARKRHWPIVPIVLAMIGLATTLSRGADSRPIPERFLSALPTDWGKAATIEVPEGQLAGIGQKLGGELTRVTNTTIQANGTAFKLNTVHCKTAQDADRVEAALRRLKQDTRMLARFDTVLVELVAGDNAALRLALDARYRLGIQPPSVRYEVSFEALPLAKSDDMSWNALFNAFLAHERGEDPEQLRALLAKFEFSDRLVLRAFGQGTTKTRWTVDPRPKKESRRPDGTMEYGLGDRHDTAGARTVTVAGKIVSQTGSATPAGRIDEKELLSATSHWPSDDPEIVELARAIVGDASGRQERVDRLLGWFTAGGLRFGGPVVGSRYGVKQVLQQKQGHCWDFADLCIALCRASGVPAREVLGWLHGVSGHVWVEVLVDEQGWRAIDPTSGLACGSDYVPIMVSHDGDVPFAYASSVQVKRVD
ncbi:MAG: transglutaminase domain-containing protein [Planctomycetes bacterium]|nr:transglutaminase domain-containing protein [Planctomycetota bacterium]